MKPISISVIVPVYKVEPYLRKCLDSICGQTYGNLEIICVDDESPDRCGEILEEYSARDSRIRVIHQRNKGLSGARNTALDAARGEYVLGVDSDDWLEPDLLERAVPHLRDGVDVLHFGTVMEDEATGERMDDGGRFLLPAEGLHPLHRYVRRMSVCFWNKIWRRELIERWHIRFLEGANYEDIPFFAMYSAVARTIYYLPYTGYHYLQRGGSIMGQAKAAKGPSELMEMRNVEQILSFYEKHNLWDRPADGLMHFILRLTLVARYLHPESQHREIEDTLHAMLARYRVRERYPRHFLVRNLYPWPRPLNLVVRSGLFSRSWGLGRWRLLEVGYNPALGVYARRFPLWEKLKRRLRRR